jgi:2-desacetyl-2-hydroxyethyl bacteriochlorophyllide A dehydrogenase
MSREVPSPGPGELRVRVEASGLCGTDLHIASGEYPFASPGVTLGHEFSGTVVGVGEGVDAFSEGDRIVVDPNIPCRVCRYCHDSRPHLCENPQAVGVTRDGGLSEFALLPVSQAYRVPEELPSEAAVLTEPLACALHAVDLGGLRPGERTLVLGAGPIGILCSMLLVAAGASEVLVSEPNLGRRERIRHIGAEPLDPEPLSGQVTDRVFECVGRPETIAAAVEAASPGGTVMWVGVAPPDAEVSVKPYDIFSRELAGHSRLLGAWETPGRPGHDTPGLPNTLCTRTSERTTSPTFECSQRSVVQTAPAREKQPDAPRHSADYDAHFTMRNVLHRPRNAFTR